MPIVSLKMRTLELARDGSQRFRAVSFLHPTLPPVDTILLTDSHQSFRQG